MVRKIIVCLLLFLMLAFSVSAESYTAYYGSISSTYLNVFRDIAEGVNLFSNDYVVWRNDDNDYAMFIGNLDSDSFGNFSGSNGQIYSLSSVRTTGSTSTYSYYDYYVRDVDSFSLSSGNVLVYSSLPGYPILHESGDKYSLLTFFVIVVFCIVFLLQRIFGGWRRY